MKRLYRLEIQGWWPVEVEEAEAAAMRADDLTALYEDSEINPYDLDNLTLRLVRASAADIARYGEGEDDEEEGD